MGREIMSVRRDMVVVVEEGARGKVKREREGGTRCTLAATEAPGVASVCAQVQLR